MAEAGVPVAASLAPLAFGAAARRRLPEAAPAVGRLLESYLAESFAGRVLAAAELEATHADLRAVETAVRGLRRGRRGAGVAYSPGPSGAFNSEESRSR